MLRGGGGAELESISASDSAALAGCDLLAFAIKGSAAPLEISLDPTAAGIYQHSFPHLHSFAKPCTIPFRFRFRFLLKYEKKRKYDHVELPCIDAGAVVAITAAHRFTTMVCCVCVDRVGLLLCHLRRYSVWKHAQCYRCVSLFREARPPGRIKIA
jgi:hypothetical protein